MNSFERFVHVISAEMEIPPIYGWFHLLFFALTVGASIFFCLRLRNAEECFVRRLFFCVWVVMVVMEIYKQLVFCMSVTEDEAVWSYAWFIFPYQLCSTPIYVLPFAILLPEGRARDAVLSYLATFSLFGGLVVMLYPGDVFNNPIGINLQTMIHHGLQAVIGVYLLVRCRKRPPHRHLLGALIVFVILTAVALVLNVAVYHALAARYEAVPVFNMFYISPYFPSTLPILSLIYTVVPYPVFLLIYIVGFGLAAALLHYGGRGICRLAARRHGRP